MSAHILPMKEPAVWDASAALLEDGGHVLDLAELSVVGAEDFERVSRREVVALPKGSREVLRDLLLQLDLHLGRRRDGQV